MTSGKTRTGAGENAGDVGNKGFGVRDNIAHHKPGFEYEDQKRELDTEGNHAFRPSEQKDIPKGTLADRIHKSK